jgi:hypothetical protein
MPIRPRFGQQTSDIIFQQQALIRQLKATGQSSEYAE